MIKDPSLARILIDHSSEGDQFKWTLDNKWYKLDCKGYESLAEFICSEILSASNMTEFCNIAKYWIEWSVRDDLKQPVSVSNNFLENTEKLVTVNDIVMSTGYTFSRDLEKAVEELISLISEFTGLTEESVGKILTAIFEFDAFVLNEDRHTRNIGIVFDFSAKQYKIGPVFDNGSALLSDQRRYIIDNPISVCIKTIKSKPFSVKFESILRICHLKYGRQLWIDEQLMNQKVDEALEVASQFYSSRYLDRIGNIIRVQSNRYRWIFERPDNSNFEGTSMFG